MLQSDPLVKPAGDVLRCHELVSHRVGGIFYFLLEEIVKIEAALLWALPGQEPERNNDDPALFDRCNVTKPVRLLDSISACRQHSGRSPYTVNRRPRRRPRPFKNRDTGEICWRLTGGKKWSPVYAPWSPDGLVHRRHDHGWAAESHLPQPGVLHRFAELAVLGADLSGCSVPAICEHVAGVVKANRRAQLVRLLDSGTGASAEIEDELLRAPALCRLQAAIAATSCGRSRHLPLLTWSWTAKSAHNLYLLELHAAGRNRADGRRITSEYRSDNHGECGPETRIRPDGRVRFGADGAPRVNNVVRLNGIDEYTQWHTVDQKDGSKEKLKIQMSDKVAAKPGPKPKHGVTMPSKLRKIKQRCQERGIPFNIAEHLIPTGGQHDEKQAA